MRTLIAIILAAAAGPLAAAQPQSAQTPSPAPTPAPSPTTPPGEEPAKPITQRDASAVDVVTTPATDLNLRKNEIPPLLLAAEAEPYGLEGLARCDQIVAEIRRIDAVLGDDIEIAQAPGRKIKAGKVAQSVVGSFIPFRGIIRELSGANQQERRLQAAIYAGTARRSFLKGVGLQRGCPWPARSATPQILAQIAAEDEARDKSKEPAKAAPSQPNPPQPPRR